MDFSSLRVMAHGLEGCDTDFPHVEIMVARMTLINADLHGFSLVVLTEFYADSGFLPPVPLEIMALRLEG